MERLGRKLAPLDLTAADRAELERWVRQCKSARALAQRARIVLASGHTDTDGLPLSQAQVARKLNVDVKTVRKWRRRFTQHGRQGLADRPRPDHPCTP